MRRSCAASIAQNPRVGNGKSHSGRLFRCAAVENAQMLWYTIAKMRRREEGACAACGRGQPPRECAAGNEEAKSFCFLHRIIWVYVDFLLSFNNYLCVWIFMCSIKEATDSEYGVVFVLALLPVVVEAIGLFLSLYMVLKGAFSAAYTVDTEGMTTYWRKTHTGFCGPTVSSLRSCRFRSTGVPRPRSYIAPRASFPRKKKRISSDIIRTILRTCSISSTVMKPFFRSFCTAFRSGRAIIWKRKRSSWACRVSKTPLHSVIRRIPQTTVAARRVLRYNQTNLCLSA